MITEFPKEGKLDVNAMHPDTDNNAKKLENFLAKERRFLDKFPEYENVLVWSDTAYWYSTALSNSNKLKYTWQELEPFIIGKVESKEIPITDLVEGVCYTYTGTKYYTKYTFIVRYKRSHICVDTEQWMNNYPWNMAKNSEECPLKIRLATSEEIQWLSECEKANKFIPKEEALKSKEEKFVLPEKWFVKPNYEQFTLVNNWAMSKSKQNYIAYMHTGNHVSYNYLGLYRNEDGCTEITYEQFMGHVYTEDVKDKSLVGRYVKALCDYPNSGKVKKNEYGLIIKPLPASVDADFPSQKNYGCTKGLFGKNYELMPEGFKPPTDKELLLEEAKKRFPIGCRYKNTIGIEFTLELDSTTYYFTGNMIYAHSGGGCLYNDGKWAEIISEETPKFEVGKWYKSIKYPTHIWKHLEYVNDSTRYSEKIFSFQYYKGVDRIRNSDMISSAVELTDLTEIQAYLPDGHPDKIKVDVVPAYVECIKDIVGTFAKSGLIFEIKQESGKIFWCLDEKKDTWGDKSLWDKNWKKYFKPSTKEAYEKQNNKQSTVMEVGKWYRLPKCSNYIVKYSSPHQCTEYIADGKYYKTGGGCNTNDAILVGVSEIQQYLPDGHVDKITKQSVHKFKIGDIVKVLKESYYYTEFGKIPSNLIIHGSYAHGSNPEAKIVNIYDKYYIVNFTDKFGKKTQVGYLEDNLVLVNPTPTMKKTGKEGKWFNHKSHGDIRYEEKIDEVLVKCYSPVHGNIIVTESSLIDDSFPPEPVVEKFTVEVKTYKFPTPSYSSVEEDELILKPFTKVKEKPKTRRYNFLVFD